jgi:serine/threonine protein kinase
MNTYLSQLSIPLGSYTIPPRLVPGIHEMATQIVATWFIIHTCTERSYMSLQSCRLAIAPACSWDHIGQALKTLLDTGDLPENLLRLHSIGHGNTTVVVGHHATQSLVAIKQQIFRRGSWEISSHILHELLALQRLQGQAWSPLQMFHVVSQDMVQIGMEYVPLDMKQMLRFGSKNRVFIHRLTTELLSAVRCLHDLGMAHRDIKPDNIRFRSDGTLVLIDYDSCTTLSDTIEKTRHVCTLGYRDPFLSDPGNDLVHYDYRMLDAFSCGAVYLYLLHGGKHVFTGTTEDETRTRCLAYIRSRLVPFCLRLKLTTAETHVLQGLLDPSPETRMTLTQASDVYRSIE